MRRRFLSSMQKASGTASQGKRVSIYVLKGVAGWNRFMIHIILSFKNVIIDDSGGIMKALELDPNCAEARNGLLRCMSSEPDEESARQRAANDPEIQAILSDPAMRLILNQMSEDPSALREHLQNPEIAEKLAKLVDAGIIALR
ncbi:unnamed protein product [Taenia asiatica]|uniref:Stress-induced-phosphoprotein 1 n=1 Tax=Taenia asiatica TaxID=60517 RepID=A0A0R3WH48_TAEAS|nr:unnamed protein product [Taenia asiatica]